MVTVAKKPCKTTIVQDRATWVAANFARQVARASVTARCNAVFLTLQLHGGGGLAELLLDIEVYIKRAIT